MQRSPEGAPCKVSAFWDGAIHKARFEPLDAASGGRRAESWRYMEAGLMVRAPYHGSLSFELFITDGIFNYAARGQEPGMPACAGVHASSPAFRWAACKS